MNSFLDPGTLGILAEHSAKFRAAKAEHVADVRALVLGVLAKEQRLTIWEVTKAVRKSRPDVGYVAITVALGALRAEGAIIVGDADGYRRN